MVISRRRIAAQAVLLALLSTLFVMLAKAEPAPAKSDNRALFEFGLIADVQYCDCANGPTRYYRSSLAKLATAVDTFNHKDLAFTMQVGDLIDRDKASFSKILPIYNQLKSPK